MPWYSVRSSPPTPIAIDVDWPLSSSNHFIKLSDDQRDTTGIIQYRLIKNEGNWVNDYILEIENKYEQYVYEFTDGEPDSYGLTCIAAKSHSVKFNSKSLVTKRVAGKQKEEIKEYSN
jgi:hypothetical protein